MDEATGYYYDTWNYNHLKENISIFDFELTQEEMVAIDAMDGGLFLNYNPYGQQYGFVRKYKDWEGFQNWNNDNKMSILNRIKQKLFK